MSLADSISRGSCVCLALAACVGCGFGVPLKQPTVVTTQAETSAAIRLGESDRAEVRSALGDPWLQSDFWRVEVYRADDKRTELTFLVAIVVPVPIGAFHEKRRGFVVVAYDAAGRVSHVSSGGTSEGVLASDSEKWATIQAGDLALLVEPVRTKSRLTLLADSSRLAGYLSERRRAPGCTLVVACDQGQGCPDGIAVGDGAPLDPSPITVLCAPDAPCPKGPRLGSGEVDGKAFFQVPVLHAIGVPAGRQRVLVTSSQLAGSGEASFECSAGEVVYGSVRSRAEGARWWTKGRLEATLALSADAPPDWAERRFVLHRDGRWLVEPEP